MESKEIGLFDIINVIFTDKEKFNNLTDFTLKRNYFMLNRIFSIKYPCQGMFFSSLGINEAAVVRAWQSFFIAKGLYGRVPQFVYTKGQKKSADSSSTKKAKFKGQILKEFCLHKHISLKDVEDYLMFFSEDATKEIKSFEKRMSTIKKASDKTY